MRVTTANALRSRRAFTLRCRERGQVIVLFAGALVLLVGMAAVTLDVSWWWVNTLRVQRAADAAALAGAVMLPNDTTNAYALARAEATKNGYASGFGVTVTPVVDPTNARRLRVTITASLQPLFAGALGISSLNISRTAVAEFGLPADVGKPSKGPLALSLAKHIQAATTPAVISRAGSNSPSSPWEHPDKAAAGPTATSCNEWARTINCGNYLLSESGPAPTPLLVPQLWGDFGVQDSSAGKLPNDPSLVIAGIQVKATVFLFGNGASGGCKITADLSSNNRVTWTTPIKDNTTIVPAVTLPVVGFDGTRATSALPLQGNITFGGPTDLWGRAAGGWTWADFKDNTPNVFTLRMTFVHNTTTCVQTVHAAVDTLELTVFYSTLVPDAPTAQTVNDPDGNALTSSNFWPAMLSQADPAAGNTGGGTGDVYMAGAGPNTSYAPADYYNFVIDIPSSGGQVWLYDAGFCDTALNPTNDARMGIGDDWLNSGDAPVSAYYELFRDGANTPYDFSDDTAVINSGTKFKLLRLADSNQGGDFLNGATSCNVVAHNDWHNTWWRLADGLAAGRYRLHAASRNVGDVTDITTSVHAVNVFGVWAKSSSGTATVHGLGTAELFVPLAPNTTTDVPLVELDASYADKWLTIDVWDPGDTGYSTLAGVSANVTTNLAILMPTAAGFSAASFYSNSVAATAIGILPCPPGGTSAATTILTSSSASRNLFHGKWLRLCTRIPASYAAPQAGVWKLRYTLGSGLIPKEDMVTVRVSVAGNPVHLVVP